MRPRSAPPTLHRDASAEKRWLRMPFEWPTPAQYALAIGVVALSLVARWLLNELVGGRVVFSLTISALLPLVLLVRPGPFLAAAALGWVGSVYLFVPPSLSADWADAPEEVLRWLFAAVMGLAVAAAWLSRRATDAREQARVALRQSEERLRIADRRKDEFLATLAHELRNPLGAIRMALGVLARPDQSAVRTRKMQGVIDRQSAQLVRLIDDLLDVSRVTRGKVELRMERVNLEQVIEHAAEGVHERCQDRNLRLTADLPKQPVFINADPMRFAQVVSNLLYNACKFTDEGGEIVVSVRREGADAVVRVRDTGIGIPPEELPYIFEFFSQAHHSRAREEGGLGIGLPLAQSIVALHGGTLRAHSEGIGRGTEFAVRVPAVDDEARADPDTERARDLRASEGARILAVDDNRDALEAVATMLRMAGHTVETAVDGAEAIEKARAQRPAVVLLDITLPALDGYEVARRIRREDWGHDTLLIAMTGWGQQRDKRRAREAGFDAHLTKPVDADELERVLRAGSGSAPMFSASA